VIDAGALRMAYDAQTRRRVPAVQPAGDSYELIGPLLRITGQYRGFIETAGDVGLRGPELDALIREQRDFFARRGEAVEWKTRAHDEPADLPQRLIAAGFHPEEAETVMIGLADQMVSGPALPDGVTLRQVTDRADFERIAAMHTEVWAADWSWLATDLESRMTADPWAITVFAADAGAEVVAAGWVVFMSGTEFAGLWGGSTRQEWRGRGIYRALVAARARLASSRGFRYLQVDASANSAPILIRLGFVPVTVTTPYVWTPPAG
jgi:GNAT superfamily N-acetyltransferase